MGEEFMKNEIITRFEKTRSKSLKLCVRVDSIYRRIICKVGLHENTFKKVEREK